MEQRWKKHTAFCLHILRFFLLQIHTASSQSVMKTLPGYPGPLPFKLETGYISVGENAEVQLFYYFIESETDPRNDPLVLWLTGGPGCSAFSGLVYEIGPLAFDLVAFDGTFPSFILNPYSWTQTASIIFLDSPVGTGFSYATTSEGYNTSDTKFARDTYLFLRKWLWSHPKFVKNRMLIAGDSYGGKIVPMVALEIAKGNEAGIQPRMHLQGYIIGNPRIDLIQNDNEMIPFAHRTALISDEYYELAKSSCQGNYANPDPNNIQCLYALRLFNECTDQIYQAHILEPKCNFITLSSNKSHYEQQLLEDDPVNLLLLPSKEEQWCRDYNYITSYVWANNETVQEALHIRKGTVTEWKRCKIKSLPYEQDVESVLKVHQLLSNKGFHALVYSGDHDMVVTYLNTLKWIRQLNITLDEQWRPWNVDGQVAGYTQKYKNNQAYLTFATVKGAGHTAPEYKPKECLAMLKRWLSFYPL